MKTFEIEPLEGVGPIRFGMSRDEVHDHLGTPDSVNDDREWFLDGFAVDFDSSGKVEFLEFAFSPKFRVAFRGKCLHEMDADDAVAWVSEFASYDHVLVSPSGEGFGFVDRVLSDHGHHRHIAHRTASFNHAAELAIISGGLTVIPESLARLRSKGAFRALPFETHPIESDIIWHASRTGDKTHTWLRRQFQSFFKTR